MRRADPGNRYDVVVIGGGHAGAEAAWAASNLLRGDFEESRGGRGRVALVTMDPGKIGAMSCNPAIGGLAKGQMVREIDALGGLMGLATDATAIQFRMLNRSKGPAVRGPRAQCDKYRYAREVQRLLSTRPNLAILRGTVSELLVSDGAACGVALGDRTILAPAVVLTTGTFMRGLMHTGPRRTEGGRIGEGSAVGISDCLIRLGFELGRLKTGTPPRLARESIDFAGLEIQPGDDDPAPFSDLSCADSLDRLSCVLGSAGVSACSGTASSAPGEGDAGDQARFPVMPQRPCHLTHTNRAIHEAIRANLDRAPLFNGQITRGAVGPRYCPSIEDKVVRFADRDSHHVYLEPESLETDEVYCNGISTSLPADVQETMVRGMKGCERAVILRHGYAVEYDMVWPHQIDATGMTKRIAGLFLAGQINGTSGYEEAAGQGLVAGLNAVRHLRRQELVRLGRESAYIGVMMDDLVTTVPREPYRMFTSRAEHRLCLRADNAGQRLTPLGRDWGLVDDRRWRVYERRRLALDLLRERMGQARIDGQRVVDWARRPEVDVPSLAGAISAPLAVAEGGQALCRGEGGRLLARVLADIQYAGYLERQRRDAERWRKQDDVPVPAGFDYDRVLGLRGEARQVLARFAPRTLGQASRLAGVTPADVMLLAVTMGR